MSRTKIAPTSYTGDHDDDLDLDLDLDLGDLHHDMNIMDSEDDLDDLDLGELNIDEDDRKYSYELKNTALHIEILSS